MLYYTAVRSPVLAQRVSDLLRELNLLVCGADEEELQHILLGMAASQALATARLREERGHGVPSVRAIVE